MKRRNLFLAGFGFLVLSAVGLAYTRLPIWYELEASQIHKLCVMERQDAFPIDVSAFAAQSKEHGIVFGKAYFTFLSGKPYIVRHNGPSGLTIHTCETANGAWAQSRLIIGEKLRAQGVGQ